MYTAHIVKDVAFCMKENEIASYYSYGMDTIYSYETINPTTVRPLKNVVKAKNEVLVSQEAKAGSLSFSLDLFPSFHQLLRLKEPIDSLNISPFAMKALKNLSLKTVDDLRLLLVKKDGSTRSIGQSHLDEIERKLTIFLNGIENTQHIDIGSFVRVTLSSLSIKEKALIAELFSLKPYCMIPTPEEKEAEHTLRRMTKEGEAALFSKLLEPMYASFSEGLSLFSSSFVTPLLEKRGGIASKETIVFACLSSCAKKDPSLSDAFRFFQKVYHHKHPTSNKPWFAASFDYIAPSFLCISKEIATTAEKVLAQAKALQEITSTPIVFTDLVHMLWKSQAKEWNHIDRMAIKELLYWSSCSFSSSKLQLHYQL